MDLVPISELSPGLPAFESKRFKAAVTLLWPYSSSARQFALLLAEPDFRLRRKKGQVRVRFSGSSAKAIATTGVGIGDEVVLSLQGTQFVQEGTVNTPGKSIDWELSYTQTVVVQVFRNRVEIANLEIVDVAPTPTPRSPVRREPIAAPAQQWSSPAFLKRVRLSDGPFLDAPYDPLADENEGGHDKKRRRKSYKDWKAWTYSARTPSPEKEDKKLEDEFGDVEASPIRPTQLPVTPVSPPKPEMLSVAAGSLDRTKDDDNSPRTHYAKASISVDEQGTEENAARDEPATRTAHDDSMRDSDYYELYAGPDEFPPSDAQYAFGGDTEVDTELNTEEEDNVQDEPDEAGLSSTEADTEEQENDQLHRAENEVIEIQSVDSEELIRGDAESATEEDSLIETVDVRQAVEAATIVEGGGHHQAGPATRLHSESLGDAPTLIVMPPPTLPTLQTNFAITAIPGTLTPIGREPASPTLQPLDSALLPSPSPFPGERDNNVSSYLDDVTPWQQPAELDVVAAGDQDPPSEADYILETSFFSSISSSGASALHPNHESAFTPVRFTFGMDGAGFSRPMELSSPGPEEARFDVTEDMQLNVKPPIYPSTSPLDTSNSHFPTSLPNDIIDEESKSQRTSAVVEETKAHDVIVLSSGSEAGESDDSEMENGIGEVFHESHPARASDRGQDEPDGEKPEIANIERSAPEGAQDHPDFLYADESGPTRTHQFAAASAIVDLSSPSEDNDDEEELVPNSHQKFAARTDDPFQLAEGDSHSEFVNMDFAPEFSNAIMTPEKRTFTHTRSQQELEPIIRPPDGEQLLTVDDHEPHLALSDETDAFMQDAFPKDLPSNPSPWEQLGTEDRHPDIKMESIEEDSLFQIVQPDTEVAHEEQPELLTEPSGELSITVPKEGHELGELYTISVPATGPARNTRSKTKTSISPAEEEKPVFKRNTQSTRSKTSATSVMHTTLSPPVTRTRSTLSPLQDGSQKSPYSLRSQSKLLSPTESTSADRITAARRSPRKHTSQKSLDSISDAGPSQLEDRDLSLPSFEPSQELGASQGRYSNVSFLKDSEEESVRSEHSIYTIRYSDDGAGAGMQYTNFSDPRELTAQDDDLPSLKPPPASAPEAKTKPGWKTRLENTDPQVVVQAKGSSPAPPTYSFITKPPESSPNRRLRSARSNEAASSSPRSVRRTKMQVYNLSPEPAEEHSQDATPKANDVAYHERRSESEDSHLRRSPPPPPRTAEIDELMCSSPPTTDTTVPPINQHPAMDNNGPITPDATQLTTMESQPSFTPVQPGQNLLMTPQLTQTTCAGVSSFQTDIDGEDIAVEKVVKTSPIKKSTPRRNATTTDVASASGSPPLKDPSSDVDSDLEPEQPSIGLSTPLAYYTPLKDLLYFLNRSSQFHSSSNPDVLALVTSSTTPSQRATKGPKHWNTTLHITDASTWPATTTVQVFRAYQTALPHADTGDIILLRAFAVKSLNRHPTLISADESAWCVWRYGKPVWGAKRGAFGEIRAREEIKGPTVEKGEAEWREVERLRNWYMGKVKKELEAKEESQVKTRSKDKVGGKENGEVEEKVGTKTRSRDKARAMDGNVG